MIGLPWAFPDPDEADRCLWCPSIWRRPHSGIDLRLTSIQLRSVTSTH